MSLDKTLGKVPTVAADTNLDLFRLDMSKMMFTSTSFDPKKKELKSDYVLADGDMSIPLYANAKYSVDASGSDRQIHPGWAVYPQQLTTDSVTGEIKTRKRTGVEIVSHLPMDLSVSVLQWRQMLCSAFAMSYIGSGGVLTERVLTELMAGRTHDLWRP